MKWIITKKKTKKTMTKQDVELWEKRITQRIRIEMAIRQVCPNCRITYNPYGSQVDLEISIDIDDFE